MGFEPGGRADKLGNRYEGRWLAKQLLRLLDEEIQAVTVEAVGEDEDGVDLWVVLKDGRRQAQQCKARNADRESWSVSELRTRGILARLRSQLDRAPDVEYVLVSAIGATNLRDICDSARNSPGPDQFFASQVFSGGKARRGEVEQFCRALDLDWTTEHDRRIAHDYLRRTRFEHQGDDDNSWRDLLTRARHLLTGQPESVVAALCAYAENRDQLGRAIYADALWKYLESQDVYARKLAHDGRISAAIERLQREFDLSIRPLLIGGSLIHRDETDRCAEAIKSEPVVVVHGGAGCGKSGVLFELIGKLRGGNTPFLALRLDRRVPRRTAAQYGDDIGLPESPVHCLVALAGERQSVLVLDQLDAIRWTSTHSAEAMDVCRELLDEARSFRRQGKDIKVVLACRTFDLQNDPQIRGLVGDRQAKVEVGPLSEGLVRSIVGPSYAELGARQRKVLANVQNLSMWTEMWKEEATPSFHSATELMKRFWAFRQRQIENEGIASADTQALLERLVRWMDERGAVSAPDRVVRECSQRALAALQSHGILQRQDDRLSFAHQSYLDYLVAVRALEAIDQGRRIPDWLGPRDRQTLFRREQLRQALTLLQEENPDRFGEEIEATLAADNVRFHLKHLVLEVVGQIEDVDDVLAEWCIGLLSDERWRAHALDTVFYGHAPHVRLLADKGVLSQWLGSKEQESQDWALRLLRSVTGKLPDLVAELLSPLVQGSDGWAERALQVIGWNAAAEADAIFELRLDLVRRGLMHGHVYWPELCAKYPLRALKLISAYISSWTAVEDHVLPPQEQRRVDRVSRHDVAALVEAGRRHPAEAWDLLMPHIVRLAAPDGTSTSGTGSRWRAHRFGGLSTSETHLAWGVVDALTEAGRTLAREMPEELLQRSQSLGCVASQLVQRIVAEAYSSLPPAYADDGLRWLLGDPARMSLGDGDVEPVWMPAARVIQALSPHCEPGLFSELEQALVHYSDPYERRYAQHRLQSWRHGGFQPYWGREQHFLLPALCAERRSRLTDSLIELLEKRFGGWPLSAFLRSGVAIGGWVGSTLDKNLDGISDRAWLAIIGNKSVPYEGHAKWHEVDEGAVVESSIWQFASSLRRVAERYPERFGQLALRFPDDTHPAYVSAILDAIRLTRPDPAAHAETPEDWEPASPSTVMAIVERFADAGDREAASAFCRLVYARPEEEWPDSAIARLAEYAQRHPDPEPDELHVDCDTSVAEATVDILFQNSINCVRGIAAGAIGRLLWQHPDWFETLQPSITALVADPHPVVRVAAVEALLPALNINPDQAVAWFCEACKDDVRVAASPRALYFIRCAIQSHPERLGPVIRDMVLASEPDVAERGAEAVAAYWLGYGFFEEELEVCRQGTARQRKGVARVAASWMKKAEYAARCRDLLRPYFDDPDKEVRDATSVMWREGFVISGESVALGEAYVRSRAFCDDPSWVLDFLGWHEGSLVPLSDLVIVVCEAFAATHKGIAPAWNALWEGTMRVLPLLLRLYEQTQERRPEIATRCLDAWDTLLEKGVGMTRELTRAISQ